MRLDCWLRGEEESCLLVAISMGDAAPGIAATRGGDKSGEAAGKSDRPAASSSSCGKSRSSLQKLSGIALHWPAAFLCQSKNSVSSRERCGGK